MGIESSDLKISMRYYYTDQIQATKVELDFLLDSIDKIEDISSDTNKHAELISLMSLFKVTKVRLEYFQYSLEILEKHIRI